jgi:hypothetical protein
MAERCRERVRLLVVILPTKVAAMWARLGEVEAQRLTEAAAPGLGLLRLRISPRLF